uniref:ATP synthase F0 subunit 8 n=1 Tax=Eiconaxius baja TaxID=2893296 RepID=UPI001EDE527A|nr:ATP synthase F0 subunit 8 [Eiconaxius baja]UIB39158.1 ATP synthase F0 subunit 8 [Eiconaxius baja]
MPQMAPLLWLNMIIVFLIMALVFFSITYYIKLSLSPEMTLEKEDSYQSFWKW